MDPDDPMILPPWPPEPITLREGESVTIIGNRSCSCSGAVNPYCDLHGVNPE